MADTAPTMTDLLHLYKPGQLSDLTYMLRNSLSKLTSAAMATAAQGDVRGLAGEITTIRTNALVAGVINTTGPNVNKIKDTLAIYATVSGSLSGYVAPTAAAPFPTTGVDELAKDNVKYAPVITYLDTALDNLCMNVIYLIIKDNITSTNATQIAAIKTLLLSFLTLINDTSTRLKISGNIMDPNFAETAERLSTVLAKKIGAVITAPGSMTYLDVDNVIKPLPASTDTTLRATPGNLFLEVSKSVSLSLTKILTAKSFDKYNTPKNITLIQSLPNLLKVLGKQAADPFTLRWLPDISGYIFPIPEPTKSLINNLNKSNFSTSLSQTPTVGILNYLITPVFTTMTGKINEYIGTIYPRRAGRAFVSMDEVYQVAANVVQLLKQYVEIMNIIINVFQIRIIDDIAVRRHLDALNNIITMSKFKINGAPVAYGGKRKKRSMRHRKRVRTTRRKRPSKRH